MENKEVKGHIILLIGVFGTACLFAQVYDTGVERGQRNAEKELALKQRGEQYWIKQYYRLYHDKFRQSYGSK